MTSFSVPTTTTTFSLPTTSTLATAASFPMTSSFSAASPLTSSFPFSTMPDLSSYPSSTVLPSSHYVSSHTHSQPPSKPPSNAAKSQNPPSRSRRKSQHETRKDFSDTSANQLPGANSGGEFSDISDDDSNPFAKAAPAKPPVAANEEAVNLANEDDDLAFGNEAMDVFFPPPATPAPPPRPAPATSGPSLTRPVMADKLQGDAGLDSVLKELTSVFPDDDLEMTLTPTTPADQQTPVHTPASVANDRLETPPDTPVFDAPVFGQDIVPGSIDLTAAMDDGFDFNNFNIPDFDMHGPGGPSNAHNDLIVSSDHKPWCIEDALTPDEEADVKPEPAVPSPSVSQQQVDSRSNVPPPLLQLQQQQQQQQQHQQQQQQQQQQVFKSEVATSSSVYTSSPAPPTALQRHMSMESASSTVYTSSPGPPSLSDQRNKPPPSLGSHTSSNLDPPKLSDPILESSCGESEDDKNTTLIAEAAIQPTPPKSSHATKKHAPPLSSSSSSSTAAAVSSGLKSFSLPVASSSVLSSAISSASSLPISVSGPLIPPHISLGLPFSSTGPLGPPSSAGHMLPAGLGFPGPAPQDLMAQHHLAQLMGHPWGMFTPMPGSAPASWGLLANPTGMWDPQLNLRPPTSHNPPQPPPALLPIHLAQAESEAAKSTKGRAATKSVSSKSKTAAVSKRNEGAAKVHQELAPKLHDGAVNLSHHRHHHGDTVLMSHKTSLAQTAAKTSTPKSTSIPKSTSVSVSSKMPVSLPKPATQVDNSMDQFAMFHNQLENELMKPKMPSPVHSIKEDKVVQKPAEKKTPVVNSSVSVMEKRQDMDLSKEVKISPNVSKAVKRCALPPMEVEDISSAEDSDDERDSQLLKRSASFSRQSQACDENTVAMNELSALHKLDAIASKVTEAQKTNVSKSSISASKVESRLSKVDMIARNLTKVQERKTSTQVKNSASSSHVSQSVNSYDKKNDHVPLQKSVDLSKNAAGRSLKAQSSSKPQNHVMDSIMDLSRKPSHPQHQETKQSSSHKVKSSPKRSPAKDDTNGYVHKKFKGHRLTKESSNSHGTKLFSSAMSIESDNSSQSTHSVSDCSNETKSVCKNMVKDSKTCPTQFITKSSDSVNLQNIPNSIQSNIRFDQRRGEIDKQKVNVQQSGMDGSNSGRLKEAKPTHMQKVIGENKKQNSPKPVENQAKPKRRRPGPKSKTCLQPDNESPSDPTNDTVNLLPGFENIREQNQKLNSNIAATNDTMDLLPGFENIHERLSLSIASDSMSVDQEHVQTSVGENTSRQQANSVTNVNSLKLKIKEPKPRVKKPGPKSKTVDKDMLLTEKENESAGLSYKEGELSAAHTDMLASSHKPLVSSEIAVVKASKHAQRKAGLTSKNHTVDSMGPTSNNFAVEKEDVMALIKEGVEKSEHNALSIANKQPLVTNDIGDDCVNVKCSYVEQTQIPVTSAADLSLCETINAKDMAFSMSDYSAHNATLSNSFTSAAQSDNVIYKPYKPKKAKKAKRNKEDRPRKRHRKKSHSKHPSTRPEESSEESVHFPTPDQEALLYRRDTGRTVEEEAALYKPRNVVVTPQKDEDVTITKEEEPKGRRPSRRAATVAREKAKEMTHDSEKGMNEWLMAQCPDSDGESWYYATHFQPKPKYALPPRRVEPVDSDADSNQSGFARSHERLLSKPKFALPPKRVEPIVSDADSDEGGFVMRREDPQLNDNENSNQEGAIKMKIIVQEDRKVSVKKKKKKEKREKKHKHKSKDKKLSLHATWNCDANSQSEDPFDFDALEHNHNVQTFGSPRGMRRPSVDQSSAMEVASGQTVKNNDWSVAPTVLGLKLKLCRNNSVGGSSASASPIGQRKRSFDEEFNVNDASNEMVFPVTKKPKL